MEKELSMEESMVLKLLMALASMREGEDVKLEPCYQFETVEEGFTVNDLFEGKINYMLYYNVGVDTHAVSIDTELKAE